MLRYSADVGAVNCYSMRMEGSTTVWTKSQKAWQSNESSIRTDMFLKQIVAGADESTITLRTRIDSGRIETNGRPMGCGGSDVVTEMKPDGTIVSNSGFQGLDLKSMQLVFPSQAVNLGDSWTSEIPASANVPIALLVVYRVCGLRVIDGSRCVEISSRVRSTGNPAVDGLRLNVQADGLIIFNVDDGVMMANDVKSQMLMRQALPGSKPTVTKMGMTMTMRREPVSSADRESMTRPAFLSR